VIDNTFLLLLAQHGFSDMLRESCQQAIVVVILLITFRIRGMR
jgi:hypothetical protein